MPEPYRSTVLMGSTFAKDLATMDGLSMQKAIEIHLTSNFYPPVPSSMAQPCMDAIDAYWEDDTDRYITMPDGVFYKGMSHAPAHAIIEQHRLYPWIEDLTNE
jgi:alpha-glucuronidase